MRFFLCLLLAFNAFRCGVEAGNAGGVKSKTGNVKVLVAQQQQSGSESVSMDIASLGLLASDDSEVATLNPSVSTIDLYGSTSSNNVLVAEGNSIPAGSYSKIAVRMKGENPVRYRDTTGTIREVKLDDETRESFYFVKDITISENGTTTIVLNLDPYKSIQASDTNNRFDFKPRGDVTRPDYEMNYNGTTTVGNAQWICAYAYSLAAAPPPDGGRHGSGQGSGGRDAPDGSASGSGRDGFHLSKGPGGDGGMPRGTKAEGRPTFNNKGELIKDSSARCENAFAKAPVISGRYEFRHLLTGTYALRVFSADGTYTDLANDITLPGE